MSLDYDLTRVKDRNTTTEGWRITETVIFGCMITRLGEITEANAAEWFARYKMIVPESKITYQDVLAHVGLRTNVFPNYTRAKWLRETVSQNLDRMAIDAKRYHPVVIAAADRGQHQASCDVTRGRQCDCAYKEENARLQDHA